MQHKSAPGLTIIELLLLIAVTLVLMVIFYPSCGCPNRAQARRAACLSNLKQLGQGARMYAEDYDGALVWNPAPGGLPPMTGTGSSGCAQQPRTSFVLMLTPYLRHAEAFACPERHGQPLSRHLGYAKSLRAAGFVSGPITAEQAGAPRVDYGFNEVLVADPRRPRTVASLLHRPSEVALLSDADRPWASGTSGWVKSDGGWDRYWSWDPAQPLRHESRRGGGRGQNFAYVDGHARFLRPALKSVEQGASGEGYYPHALLE